VKKMLVFAAAFAVAFGSIVLAGEVFDRSPAITLHSFAGTAGWTNTYQYAAIKLDRIDIVRSSEAGNTVTVARVTSDGALTNTICTITNASGAGSYAVVQTIRSGPQHMAYGDRLTFAAAGATGATAYVGFEVQKH